MKTRGSFRIVLLIVAMNLLVLPVFAGGAKGNPDDAAKSEKAGAPAKAPDEAAALVQFRLAFPDLAKMLNHDSTNLQVVRMPDGSESLDLQGGFRSVLIVQTTPSGEHVISCIDSEKTAAKIFTPKAVAPAKE